MVNTKMNRQVNCKHYETEARKTSVYTYSLIGLDINCCNKCEKKLRKQILEQIEAENGCISLKVGKTTKKASKGWYK